MKVKDPTKRSRGAAILAETVAVTMGNAVYAYIAVPNREGWVSAIVVEGEHGCWQINGGFHFEKREEADYFARGMNVHIGLTPVRAIEIVASSMRAQVTCPASKMIFVPMFALGQKKRHPRVIPASQAARPLPSPPLPTASHWRGCRWEMSPPTKFSLRCKKIGR